jgi:hypothetical protein
MLNYGMATMRVNSWRRHYRSTGRDASRSIRAPIGRRLMVVAAIVRMTAGSTPRSG